MKSVKRSSGLIRLYINLIVAVSQSFLKALCHGALFDLYLFRSSFMFCPVGRIEISLFAARLFQQDNLADRR